HVPVLAAGGGVAPPSFLDAPRAGADADGSLDVLAADRGDATAAGGHFDGDGRAERAGGGQSARAGRGAARVGRGRGSELSDVVAFGKVAVDGHRHADTAVA